MHKALITFNRINPQKRYQVPIKSGLSQFLIWVKKNYINIFAYSTKSQLKQDYCLWQDKFSGVYHIQPVIDSLNEPKLSSAKKRVGAHYLENVYWHKG